MQATTIRHNVSVELVGVGMPEAYFDLTGLPLIDAVIRARSPGDKPEHDAYPVRQAMRRRHIHIEPSVIRPCVRDQIEIAG